MASGEQDGIAIIYCAEECGGLDSGIPHGSLWKSSRET